MIGGLGKINDQTIMFIGTQKGTIQEQDNIEILKGKSRRIQKSLKANE